MKKELLGLALLLTSCGRGDEFYKKRCVYHDFKDERAKFCESDYHIIKADKSEEKTDVQTNLKPAEPKLTPQPSMSEVKKIDERVKFEEEIKYEKWVKQVEEAVGKIE